MSLVPNRALEGAAGNQGYNLQRSLRFRSSASTYLSRTQTSSVTNNNKWTFSCWVKRGTLGTTTSLLSSYSGTGASQIYFDANDKLRIFIPDNGGVTKLDYVTTQVFRDPSAFYHIVISLDNTLATSVLSLYLNGTSVTSFSTSTNSLVQNGNYQINKASTPMIIGEIYNNGAAGTLASGYYFDGYLAEVNFIDGQALTPSSFGETDSTTGVWKPKKYGGSYGTNGFYLPFSDNTSATTLAYDKSGNSNNWTANNISTTAGATYDSMTDVPTLTSATAANYATLNPLFTNTGAINAFYYGNLELLSPSAANSFAPSTISVSSGKFYFEVTAGTIGAGGMTVGIWQNPILNGTSFSSQTNYRYYSIDGKIYNSAGGTVQTYSTYTSNDIIGVALDLDNGKVYYSKNGTWQGSSNPATQTNPAVTGLTGEWVFGLNVGTTSGNYAFANFGQQPFSYTPPTGFVALNTYNLPTPTILAGNKYMDATLYSGTSASQTVTNAGAFQPDLVWIKSRSAATDHKLTDSVRGTTKALISDTTGAETTDTNGLTAFNSNGFTVGSDSVYNNGTGPATYVGWQWKAGGTSSSNTSGDITSTVSVNPTAGFSVVTWTSDGAAAVKTVGHGLGVTPAFFICKNRSATSYWFAYHQNLTSNNYYLHLESTDAQYNTGAAFFSENSTTIGVRQSSLATNGQTCVAYVWAEIAGFSAFGKYTGNGSADGPFVYCGFRPKYVLWKNTSTGGDGWYIYDSVRQTYNAMTTYLSPTFSVAEGTNGGAMDILSNGFKVRNTGTDMNTNGNTYIYAAFAENPQKFSLAR